MANGKVSYGRCAGVDSLKAPHIYRDGKMHHPDSHGLCPECRELTMQLFREEISKSKQQRAQTSPPVPVSEVA